MRFHTLSVDFCPIQPIEDEPHRRFSIGLDPATSGRSTSVPKSPTINASGVV
ncbi:hypothetical protein LMG28614_07257 [Paraburkholderia ultramafica]|uniref:Uncharacterized protein n=1 Tax=Paraburkholderia ultramafica TaxID=1544867 RepID=A0A6S7BQX8_9BURK|nr:hypothetical protein LMG28614_07257 [Paraburkholderia ultramafica]